MTMNNAQSLHIEPGHSYVARPNGDIAVLDDEGDAGYILDTSSALMFGKKQIVVPLLNALGEPSTTVVSPTEGLRVALTYGMDILTFGVPGPLRVTEKEDE